MGWKSFVHSATNIGIGAIPVVGDIYSVYKEHKSEKAEKKAERRAVENQHAVFADEMETKRKNVAASKTVYAGVLSKPNAKNLGNEKTLLGS